MKKKGDELAFRLLSLWLVIVTFVFHTPDAEAKKRRRNSSYESGRAPSSDNGDRDDEVSVFDPFGDYSEFESTPEEEEDISFFKNGRMLTFGFQGGMHNYTNEMAQKYQPSFRYGLFISYFFDLHFAVQLNWLNTDSAVSFRSPSSNLTGNSSLSSLGFQIKYFLNTQNVTKGLADLNPYFLVGMVNHGRTVHFSAIPGTLRDSATGFNGGIGVEIPMLRKKLFWGVQLAYDLANFKDENVPFTYDGLNYGTARGDMWSMLGSIGINF